MSIHCTEICISIYVSVAVFCFFRLSVERQKQRLWWGVCHPPTIHKNPISTYSTSQDSVIFTMTAWWFFTQIVLSCVLSCVCAVPLKTSTLNFSETAKNTFRSIKIISLWSAFDWPYLSIQYNLVYLYTTKWQHQFS